MRKNLQNKGWYFKQTIYLRFFLLFVSFLLQAGWALAQDDLMKELEADAGPQNEKVTATFKANRVVNAHTCETVKKRTLDFRITHRFSNIMDQANGSGGFHQFYGFDNASDIRFSFDYGITDKLQVGIGRSKQFENIDGSVKFKILEQTENNRVPLTIVGYANTAYTPVKESQLYAGADIAWVAANKKPLHRLCYTYQLIVARKFGSRLSMELLPTLNYRNLVYAHINPSNSAMEDNLLYAVGFAARVKVTSRFSLVGDYFYTISKFRQNNASMPYYAPLGLGFELETGGHVFTINFTNSSSIIENSYLPYTNESWSTGAFKLGFNISRVFSL